MKNLYKLFRHYKLSGILIYLKIRLNFSNKITVPHIKTPIHLRKNTSDIPTFFQIFSSLDYEHIPIKFKPKTIIDLGANIGLAAIFFANKYPESKIYSVEPEASNFQLLQRNTASYENIHLYKNAISNINDINVDIIDSGYGKWAFMTKTNTSSNAINGIKTITIDKIIDKENIKIIDILKIDIEGAEKELFESNYEKWIPITRCIVVELHDWLKKGTSKSFFKCISQYDFSFTMRGENIVLINEAIE